MKIVLVVLVSLVFAGCGMRNLSFIDSGVPFARRANVLPSQVRLYRAGDALPRFTELGYLEYDQIVTAGATDMIRVQRVLAQEAANRGCNAIVIHDGCSRVTRDRSGTHTLPRIAATCIWADDG